MSVPLERVDHVQMAMPVGREDEARFFYEGLLGIPEKPKPAHLAARGGCWFESGNIKIHLGVEQDFRPAKKAHPALIATGLGDLTERLVTAGIQITADEPLDGYDRIYAYDPFGNRIELMEPLHPMPN
jgi:catechol 2,3-dioxygenase-like lactoylglutathione lyase family enzyme